MVSASKCKENMNVSQPTVLDDIYGAFAVPISFSSFVNKFYTRISTIYWNIYNFFPFFYLIYFTDNSCGLRACCLKSHFFGVL